MTNPLAPMTPQAALERRLLCLIAQELEDYRLRYGVAVASVEVRMRNASTVSEGRYVVERVTVGVAQSE